MSHRRDIKGEPLVDPSENLPAGVHPAHPGGFSSLTPPDGISQLFPVLLPRHTRSPTTRKRLREAPSPVSQGVRRAEPGGVHLPHELPRITQIETRGLHEKRTK